MPVILDSRNGSAVGRAHFEVGKTSTDPGMTEGLPCLELFHCLGNHPHVRLMRLDLSACLKQ